VAESILDNPEAMKALADVGFGVLVIHPAAGATNDDEKIERMVIRMVEHMRDFGADEAANYVDLVCAAVEFAARIVAAPLALQNATRQQQRKTAQHMAENLRTRILGACRGEGAGTEHHDN